MFYLRREREERAKGRSPREALEIAAATSGRAVLISGFTVMIAMAGMYFAGVDTFVSFGTGTILVVAVAMIGSLTVLPALLAVARRPGREGPHPGLAPAASSENGESRVWGAVIDRVMRRPKLAAALSAGLLVALALPALGMHTELPGYETLPRDMPIMQTYDRIQAAFPGGPAPAVVVVEADDVTAPAGATAIERPARPGHRRAASRNDPVTVEVSKDKSVAIVSLPIAGNGTDDAARSGARRAPRRRRPGHDRPGRRRRRQRHRRDRRHAATSTTLMNSRIAASCSRSSCRWRSCSCWSRSARSSSRSRRSC